MNAKTLRKYGKNKEMLMGSIPVICLFEISLKVRESQYLSAFPRFSLFPEQKHFCLKMQHALQVQFLNQSILQYL